MDGLAIVLLILGAFIYIGYWLKAMPILQRIFTIIIGILILIVAGFLWLFIKGEGAGSGSYSSRSSSNNKGSEENDHKLPWKDDIIIKDGEAYKRSFWGDKELGLQRSKKSLN